MFSIVAVGTQSQIARSGIADRIASNRIAFAVRVANSMKQISVLESHIQISIQVATLDRIIVLLNHMREVIVPDSTCASLRC